MTDALEGAANMAATGVGIGILAMGAMVPIKMMSNMVDDMSNKKKRKKKSAKKAAKKAAPAKRPMNKRPPKKKG